MSTLSLKINDLYLEEVRKIPPLGLGTVLRKSRMFSRCDLFLCKLADGKGEGEVSLGGLWSFYSICHFLQEVPKHGGVIISAIWGPAGSHHSPFP